MGQDPYRYFRLEARELLDQLGKAVMELETGGGADVVQRMLRHAHTLKGAARVVRLPEIADHAHAVEDALARFRDEPHVPAETIAKLLVLVDAIAMLVAPLEARPAVPAATAALAEDTPRSVRADLAEVEALLDGVMESHARLGTLRGSAATIANARQLAELLVEHLAYATPRGGGGSGRALAIAEQLRDQVRDAERGLGSGLDELHREMLQVRDRADHLRLVPAESQFVSLERTVRDAARSLGKEVRFEARGGDVRIDAHVLGIVHGALVQLARNAVAHGVEAPARRVRAGKPTHGVVQVEVSRRGRRVVFRCRDDGQGVDLDAVRRAALRAGVPAASATSASASDLVRLLLRGGITTAATVTEVSGRGVGLDVVRDAAERLGGTVTVDTGPHGTTFELHVPASLASLEALEVEMAGHRAILPIDCLRLSTRISSLEISRSAGAASVVHDGVVVPFVSLVEALGAPADDRERQSWSIAIVAGEGGQAAIGADRFLGITSVVVRPLPELAAPESIVAGAALDAEGNPVLVLDPDGIVAEARRERAARAVVAKPRVPVLVIDDSLTTRMLEQSILESAGFDVDTATSGEQALDAARKRRYALFLVDVEMPGIDGFEFIERIRADAELRHTPAILVTSRSSSADRRRGEEVGASGYMVKSEFDQGQLVANIHRLVG